MAIKVLPTEDFIRSLKHISKKHKGISADIAKLSGQLKEDPHLGSDLGNGLYKIRLSVTGNNKGRSGGARVITYVVLVKETVYLAEIYLKNEYDAIDTEALIKRLKDQGIL